MAQEEEKEMKCEECKHKQDCDRLYADCRYNPENAKNTKISAEKLIQYIEKLVDEEEK